MAQIFISYRRADSRAMSRRLYDALADHYGARLIFRDSDTIPKGQNFLQIIEQYIIHSKVVLVLIGPDWLDIRDETTGARRLDDPEDFVRVEVDLALRHVPKVIPVLLDDTPMPTENDLPRRIAGLAYQNAVQVRDATFDDDMQALFAAIGLRSRRERARLMWGALLAIMVMLVFAAGLLALNNRPPGAPGNLRTQAVLAMTAQFLPPPTETANVTQTIQRIQTEVVQTATADALATIEAYTDTPSHTPTPTSTATATPQPPTPTPDSTQTAAAQVTQQGLATEERATQIAQLTANAPTNTPQPTPTPSWTFTPTPSVTPTPPPTLAPTGSPTLPPETVTAAARATRGSFETQVFQTAVATQATGTARAVESVWVVNAPSFIRANPSMDAAVVGSVLEGTALEVIAFSSDRSWRFVRLQDGTEGWIARNLVDAVTVTPNMSPEAVLAAPTQTPSLTPTVVAASATALPETLQAAYDAAAAYDYQQGNAAWSPIVQDFDGVAMVLVPPGCFMMGSDDGRANERPAHEQCFDEPFWIDRYEVTGAQFDSSGEGADDDMPLERVDWFAAQAHCASRGGRLPTEAEWEYAARGPDSLVYPWGNAFDGGRVNFCDSNCALAWADDNYDDGYPIAAPVGRFPEGASWVGALDLSGNVWEWVSTIYLQEAYPYPYAADDGREGDDPDARRVVRGGQWRGTDNGLRAAFRVELQPNSLDAGGFRCMWR